MKKIISLFSDQDEAGDAIEVLAAAGFEDAEIQEFEERSTVEPEPIAVAPIHQGGYGAATPVPLFSFFSDLNDSEAEEFLKRSLESGGVVVVVEPSDDDESAEIKRIIREQGGQIVS